MMFRAKRQKRDGLFYVLPLVVVALAISGCGGGGGGGITSFSISGTVSAPNSPTFAPLEDATVKVYLLPELTLLNIPPTRTDANGRYTLAKIPIQFAGRDLLIVAERERGGQRVRTMTLCPNAPREGTTGIDLNPYTTYAAQEVIRWMRENNRQRISPNGFAEVLRQVQEQLENRPDLLNPIVGQTLPENLGGEIPNPTLRDIVRPIVNNQGKNLEPPQGDIAIAKGIAQMLRDMGSSGVGIGDTESLRLENELVELSETLEKEVVEPLDIGQRGLDYLFEVLDENSFRYPGIYDLPPGRYEHRPSPSRPYISLERVGNTDDRTWIIENKVQGDRHNGVKLTIQTQQPIPRFKLGFEMGKLTAKVRSARDSQLQYDFELAVLQRDAQNRPTKMGATFTLRDSKITQPVQFTGTLTGTPKPGGGENDYQTITFNGSLTGPYGSIELNNLAYDFDKLEATAATIRVTPKSSKQASVEIQGLTIVGRSGTGSRPQLQKLTATRIRAVAHTSTLTLENVEMDTYYPSEEDDQSFPRRIRARLNYVGREQLQGTIDFSWENVGQWPYPDYGWSSIPLNRFPRGTLVFNGTVQPQVGRTLSVSFSLFSEPNNTPPRARLDPLVLAYGDQTLKGTIVGKLKVIDNAVYRDDLFASGTLEMTHTPSGFRVALSAEGETVRGEIKKSDNTRIAQIGRARDLGMPDLGNLLIIKYNDGTFESLQSLFLR